MKRDKKLTTLTRALVHHCMLQYGGTHSPRYATDMLRDLSTALRRACHDNNLTIDEFGELLATVALDLPKRPKKKKE